MVRPGHLLHRSPLLGPLELRRHEVQPLPALRLLARHHGEGLHPVVGGVVVAGTGIAAALQELVGGGDVAEEGRPALGHEEDLVEHLDDLTAWLVNGADDGPALAGQSAQGLHHRGRHVAVQARGGLVTEHDAGVGQDLTGQRQPLPLTSRYPLLTLVLLSNHRVRAFR